MCKDGDLHGRMHGQTAVQIIIDSTVTWASCDSLRKSK